MMSAAATKTKPRVMSRGGIIACTVLTLLTPVGLLLIHLARGNAEEVGICTVVDFIMVWQRL